MSVTVIKFSYWEENNSAGCFWPKLAVHIMASRWLRAPHEAGDVLNEIHTFSSAAPELEKERFW